MKKQYFILLALFLLVSLNTRATTHYHTESKKDWSDPKHWTTGKKDVESVYAMLSKHNSTLFFETTVGPTISVVTSTTGCINGGIIDVTVSGATGPVQYALLGGPSTYTIPGPGSSFPGLANGTYTVQVWDDNTNGTPITQSVTINYSYTSISISSVVPTYDNLTTPVCGPRGILIVNATGGNAPLSYSLINKTTGALVMGPQSSNRFTSVPVGTYSVEVKDACGNTMTSAAGGITVTNYDDVSTGTSLSATILSTGSPSPNVYFRENSGCDMMTVTPTPGITVFSCTMKNASGKILNIYQKDIEYRVGTPDGNWSAWVASDMPASVPFTLTTNANVDFTFQFRNGCDHFVTATATYSYKAFNGLTGSMNYTYSDNCSVTNTGLQVTANNAGDNLTCMPMKIEVYDQTAGNTLLADPSFGATSYKITSTYTTGDVTGFIPGHTLKIIMTDAKGLTISGTYVVPSPVLPAFAMSPNPRNSLASNNCGFTGRLYDFNYGIGKTNTGPFPVTFTVTSGPASMVGKSVTVNNTTDKNLDGSTQITYPFGYYLPYGTYSFTLAFGDTGAGPCRTVPITNFDNTQNYKGLHLGNVTSVTNVNGCGVYDLNIPYYYTDMAGNPVPASSSTADGVWISLIDASGTVVKRQSQNSINYLWTNINPGTYTIRIAPAKGQYVDPNCYSDSQTITIDRYSLPVVDVQHSGGLVCSGVTKGNLTVVATGTSAPLQYAYKKKGDPDTSYSAFQASNVFPALTAGVVYTVAVKDQCNNTVTQDLTVSIAETISLLSVEGATSGSVCSGGSVKLKTIPIGPVTNYQWTLPDGTIQQGAALDHIDITNFTTTNNGSYTVEATSAAGCSVTSTIALTVATDLNLVVANPAAVCAGTTVNLANAVSGVASYIYYAADQTTVLASAMVTPATTTDYYVQGTSASGCILPKQKITVTVNPVPALVITNPATVTSGTTVNLTVAAITAGSTNIATLDYYTDAACTIPVTTPSAVTITGNKTYYIKATATGGCTDIKPVAITAVGPSITVAGTNGTCASDCSVTASTSWTVDPLVAQYKLTNTTTGVSVGPVTGPTANIFDNLIPGTYTVTIYDGTTGAAGLTSAPVTVTSPYKQLKLTPITVSGGTGCGGAGTITYGSTLGKQPVDYWIVNSGGTTIASETNSLGTVTFTGVPPGTYTAYAKDACNTTVWEDNVKVTGLDLSALGSVKIRNAQTYFGRGSDCNHMALDLWAITPYIELYKADGVTPITADTSKLTYILDFTTGSPAVTTSYTILPPGDTSLDVAYTPFTPTQYRIRILNPCTGTYINSAWVNIQNPAISVTTDSYASPDMCASGGLALMVQWNTRPCFPITNITVTDANDPSKVYTFPDWTDSTQGTYALPGVPAGTYYITAKDAIGHLYNITATSPGGKYKYKPVTQDVQTQISQGCTLGKVNISITGVIGAGPFPITYTITSAPAALSPIPAPYVQTSSTGVYGYTTIFKDLPAGNYTLNVAYGDGAGGICRNQTITGNVVAPIVSYELDKLWYTGCASGSNHAIYGSITGVDGNGKVFHTYDTDNGPGMTDNIFANAHAEIISGPPAYTGPTGKDSEVMMPQDGTQFSFPALSSTGTPLYTLPAGTYKIGVYPEYFMYNDRECLSSGYPIEKTITIVDGGTLTLDKTNSGGVVCSGTTGTLIVNAIGAGPFTYQYKPKGSATYSAAQTSNEFPGLTAGDYDVKIIGACISIEETLTMLSTSATSLLTITPAPAVCEGQQAVISVAPIGPINSIVWTLNGTPFTAGLDATSTTLTIPSFTSANAGTYAITVTSAAGCNFTSTLAVTLDTPPTTPTISTTGSVPTCIGGTATMAATPAGGKWSSSNSAVLSIDSITGFATALTVGNANIIYTASSAGGGCTATATLPVTVGSCTATLADLDVFDVSACPNTSAALTATSTTVSSPIFTWYSNASLTTIAGTSTNTTSFIAPVSSAALTYFVTVQGTGILENKAAAKQVNVYLSNACGIINPDQCATTGSLLYKEDFGGNNSSDPLVKSSGIAQVVGLSYVNATQIANAISGGIYPNDGHPDDGQYIITKIAGENHPAWIHNIDDHTSFGDPTKGYSLQINADYPPAQFYQANLGKLCSGTKLYFSTWIANVYKNNNTIKPNLTFVLENPVDGSVVTKYYTGDIPANNAKWVQYGFNFTVPVDMDDLRLRIINNVSGGTGNDFALDDIEIHACTPPVTISGLAAKYCEDDKLSLTASYVDDGTFGSTPSYQWYYSPTNDLTSWDSWTAVSGANTAVLNQSSVQEGFYRVVVGAPTNIASRKFNCLASSLPAAVKVNKPAGISDLTVSDVTICKGSTATLEAATTNIENPIFNWYNDAVATVALYTGAKYSPAVTSTKDYYVTVQGTDFCESPRKKVTVTVNDCTAFTTVKTVADANNNGKAEANENLTYTITVKNTGSATINT
ncbi:Ig-like domain-containing protein, partial [Flavobacterium chilense]